METPNKTANQLRKTIQLAPQVHECLMSRLTRYRVEVGYHASINELVMHILNQEKATEITVKIEPLHPRQPLKVDNYRLTSTR